MVNNWKWMALAAPLALVAACTDGARAPAEAALAAAGAAIDSLKGDAARYAPDEVKKLESLYDVAKASMANKDYQGVLNFAKDIPAKAREALARADTVKSGLAKDWKEAGDDVARTIEVAKQRLDAHGKAPAGMGKAALATAQADLAAIEAGWTAATEQYKAGDWSGAVARAKDLSAKGKELLHSLGTK